MSILDLFSFVSFGSVFGGLLLWIFARWVVTGFYVVDQNERAVKTTFGRAHRIGAVTTSTSSNLSKSFATDEERERYNFPVLRVIPPGGPYFKMPWEKVLKVSVATRTINMAFDPDQPSANNNGTRLEAVTKDQLNTALTGEIRFQVSEQNLYAYLFAIKRPISHVMGYFISILRQRIANFEAKKPDHLEPDSDSGSLGFALDDVKGVSINDLRKNLRDLNSHMDTECASSAARYGITLEASLITAIEPPQEVESALAAINTAHNHVSSDISLARASADQRIVESKRAVEIETLKAQAEVEPLIAMADELKNLKKSGSKVLPAFVRNQKLALIRKADRVILEQRP